MVGTKSARGVRTILCLDPGFSSLPFYYASNTRSYRPSSRLLCGAAGARCAWRAAGRRGGGAAVVRLTYDDATINEKRSQVIHAYFYYTVAVCNPQSVSGFVAFT